MPHDSYNGCVFKMKGRPTWQMKFYDPMLKKVVRRPSLVPVDAPCGEAAARVELENNKLAFTSGASVRQWSAEWLLKRLPFPDYRNNKGHLDTWILPVLGEMVLGEVTPQNIDHLIQQVKVAERAPRTVRNVYSTLSAMFRDARIAGRLPGDLAVVGSYPCILRARQLGKVEDKESGWRAGAVFSRTELRMLLTDDRIPLDRRVQYGLLGVGALRDGEMCALRWGDIQVESPLNRMVIRRNHDRDRTKTVPERWMPIHPVLQELLAVWARGYEKTFGAAIGQDTLVIPTMEARNRGPRVPKGTMRNNNYVYKRWLKDLTALGLTHRRVHDLRRTFISMAKGDGAVEGILKWATHSAPTHVMALYTSYEWEKVCGEVSKLKLSLLPVEKDEAELHLQDLERGPVKMVFGDNPTT